MKSKALFAALAVVALGLAGGYAYATSCAEPGYSATLVPLDGGPDDLCLSVTQAERVIVRPCDRQGAFDDEVYTR